MVAGEDGGDGGRSAGAAVGAALGGGGGVGDSEWGKAGEVMPVGCQGGSAGVEVCFIPLFGSNKIAALGFKKTLRIGNHSNFHREGASAMLRYPDTPRSRLFTTLLTMTETRGTVHKVILTISGLFHLICVPRWKTTSVWCLGVERQAVEVVGCEHINQNGFQTSSLRQPSTSRPAVPEYVWLISYASSKRPILILLV